MKHCLSGCCSGKAALLQAKEQGWDLLKALSSLWPSKGGQRLSHRDEPQGCSLPDLQAVECLKTREEVAAIVVGVVQNLLLSVTEPELDAESAATLERLSGEWEGLQPWLRCFLLISSLVQC